MESFGKVIKKLRSERGLLLREVAASLQIDPSLLSRIESSNKHATREHVIRLAAILNTDENELLINYLSDKIIYQLQGEELAIEAMLVAEKKIRYFSPGHLSGSLPSNPLPDSKPGLSPGTLPDSVTKASMNKNEDE